MPIYLIRYRNGKKYTNYIIKPVLCIKRKGDCHFYYEKNQLTVKFSAKYNVNNIVGIAISIKFHQLGYRIRENILPTFCISLSYRKSSNAFFLKGLGFRQYN